MFNELYIPKFRVGFLDDLKDFNFDWSVPLEYFNQMWSYYWHIAGMWGVLPIVTTIVVAGLIHPKTNYMTANLINTVIRIFILVPATKLVNGLSELAILAFNFTRGRFRDFGRIATGNDKDE
jgi:hypothetical protein